MLIASPGTSSGRGVELIACLLHARVSALGSFEYPLTLLTDRAITDHRSQIDVSHAIQIKVALGICSAGDSAKEIYQVSIDGAARNRTQK